jgi:hypothetical protein
MKRYQTTQYIKLAQLYHEVEDFYAGEDPETLDAYRYFSIGQNEETCDEGVCWLWYNNKLLVGQSGSHRSNFGHWFNNDNWVDKVYRGWYDPIQELLSVLIPIRFTGEKHTEADIPNALNRALRNKFGNKFEYVVF